MLYNDSLREGKLLKELHMFYLLDTSGSMQGEGIAQLNSGMRETIRILQNLFVTSEDVWLRISVMTFSHTAQWVTGTPYSKHSEYIEDFFDFPEQYAKGPTRLASALELLRIGLSPDEMLESPTGNKRPIIIVMSDGTSCDCWESVLPSLQENWWFQQSIRIAIALGLDANERMLAQVVGDQESVLCVPDISRFASMLVDVSVASSLAGSKRVLTPEGVNGAGIVAEIRGITEPA